MQHADGRHGSYCCQKFATIHDSSFSSGGLSSPGPPHAVARGAPRSPLRSRGSLALARSLAEIFDLPDFETTSSLIRGASPLGLPYTRSRAPLRRRAPIAWLACHARSHPGTSVTFVRPRLASQRPPRPVGGGILFHGWLARPFRSQTTSPSLIVSSQPRRSVPSRRPPR